MGGVDGKKILNDIGMETSFRWSPPEDMVGRGPALIDSADPIRDLAVADTARWGKLAYWTLDEAAALYIGKSPDGFVWSDVERWVSSDATIQQCQQFRRAAEGLFSDGLRHTPKEIIEWAKNNDLIFPSAQISAVKSSASIQVTERECSTDWDEMHMLSKMSIYNLILALVIDGYKIDPTGPLKGMKNIEYANSTLKFGDTGRRGPSYDTVNNIIKEAVQMTGLRSQDVAAVLNGKSVSASHSFDRR